MRELLWRLWHLRAQGLALATHERAGRRWNIGLVLRVRSQSREALLDAGIRRLVEPLRLCEILR